ncbi:MAG: bifunctional folylpolyglutamate synthase/dihydrofolate synthase [Bacteroidota bacterium]|nr:bifunctional folylpolyglutamate synthase/dihydrofolate synthase [Bacteroidota bacterium]
MAAYEAYLLGLPRYSQLGNRAMKPGIRGVGHLLDAMGHPQRQLRCVHIAGTNGKGSTAAMIAAIAQSAGLRTALFTSPHLIRMNERIRINGRSVKDAVLNDAVRCHRATFDRLQPSFFEAITALAFLCFAEAEVELAVIETGLGGRLDATNIIQPAVSVITQIALDHESTLGSTLPEIAQEKGGIIKRGVPVVARPEQPEVRETLQALACARGAPWEDPGTVSSRGASIRLRTPVRSYRSVRLGMPGRHQQCNALLALRAAELAVEELASDASCALEGLARTTQLTGLRGRLQQLQAHPKVILDVAHNPASIRAALAHASGRGAVYVVFGLMRDKNLAAIAQLLATHAAWVFTCDLNSPRAWPSELLARKLAERGVPIGGFGPLEGIWAQVCRTVRPNDTILICGSHYLAGDFLSRNETDPLALCV